MSVSWWATVLVAAVLVTVVGGAAGGVVLAEVRAQDGADAAALAAAHASHDTAGSWRAAAQAASEHGATLRVCDCSGTTVTVTVEATVSSRAARLSGVRTVSATATAALLGAPPHRAEDAVTFAGQRRKLSRK